MRRFALPLGCITLALALGPHAPGAAPVPKHLMPKEPPFGVPVAVGTTWVYDTGNGGTETITITKVEDKDGEKHVTTEYVRPNGRSHHMTQAVGPKGVFLVAECGKTYEKPWCIYQLPHKDGSAWQTEGHGGDMRAGPTEKVKTPAGEIEANRVDWSLGDGRTAAYWYSARYGLVVMGGDGATKRLKSFTPGKE